MRLSKRLQNIIKKALSDSFGPVDVYLFGSRVDDSKKGGDIDLAIDTNISKEGFKKKKIQFISLMVRFGFDLKIDVVQYPQNNELFLNEIQSNSIKLV